MDQKQLEEKVQQLHKRIGRSKAVVDILNLQACFSYYLEANEIEKLLGLFAEDPETTCEVYDSGIYKGSAKIREFWEAREEIQAQKGYMGNLMIKTPYVNVDEDGQHAVGIWHGFGAQSLYAVPYPCDEEKLTAVWFMGKFYNEYVLENGKWKILSLKLMPHFYTPFEEGWIKQSDCYRVSPAPDRSRPSSPNKTIYMYHPHGDIEEFLGKLPEPE